LRSRFRRGSLSCERGALDLRVEQDVGRFPGLPVHGVVGHDDEQVERDGSGVVGLQEVVGLGLLPGGLVRGEDGLHPVPDFGGDQRSCSHCINAVLADDDLLVSVIWTLTALVRDRTRKVYDPDQPRFLKLQHHGETLVRALVERENGPQQ
jgi:hypothetical protein